MREARKILVLALVLALIAGICFGAGYLIRGDGDDVPELSAVVVQHQLEQVGSEGGSLDDELRSDKRYCGWERAQLRPKDVIKELQTDVEGVGDVIEVVCK